MTQFLVIRDLSGSPVSGLNSYVPADNIYSVLLAATVAQQFTVPSKYSKWFVRFTYQAAKNVFVRLNGTAAAPDGTIGTEVSEMLPNGWVVADGDTISFITPDAGGAYVSATLYGIE